MEAVDHKNAFVALLVGILVGNLACALETKTCTTIGCTNQATLTVRRPNGSVPPLEVEVDVDGRRVVCAAPQSTGAGSFGRSACDDPQVAVDYRSQVDCVETRTAEARSLSCTPNGRMEQVITFNGTPQRVAVTLKAGTDVVTQQTFDLQYADVRPNGDDCDPICRQAAVALPLP